MSSSIPRRVIALRGRVIVDLYGKGSKSERDAVFLVTSTSQYILRRKTGPVFGDPELDQYIGHEVQCDGFVIDTTLLAERIEIVD